MTRSGRVLALTLVAVFAACPAGTAAVFAASAGGATPRESRKAPESAATLLDALAAAPDEETASRIASRVEQLWQRSGSDTVDLLMARGVVALGKGDSPLAIELMDRAIALRPGWAEGWNKRAAAFFALGDYQRALVDLRETLRREPRQFNALAALGLVLRAYDDDKDAMKAFRRALAIHPHLEAAKKAVQSIGPDVEGRDL